VKVGDLVEWAFFLNKTEKPELGIIIEIEEDHIKVVDLSERALSINWWNKINWKCVSKSSEKKP